uniref:Uncharacterized protein n=1 Tax=Oryza punctata TaxID=4537 RepID=A0A0E0JVR5_ORYPU
MSSTCRSSFRPVVSGGDSGRIPPRLLKLMSRMTILPDDITSDGNPPDNELCDRFRCSKLDSLPRAGDMLPSSFLEANMTSVTVGTLPAVLLQVMPSHEQQSLPCRHDAARPPSCESPARNWSRQLLSCSAQQLVEDAEESISTRTRQRIDMDNLLRWWDRRWRWLRRRCTGSPCGIDDRELGAQDLELVAATLVGRRFGALP